MSLYLQNDSVLWTGYESYQQQVLQMGLALPLRKSWVQS